MVGFPILSIGVRLPIVELTMTAHESFVWMDAAISLYVRSTYHMGVIVSKSVHISRNERIPYSTNYCMPPDPDPDARFR
jgi:hypothetical protein